MTRIANGLEVLLALAAASLSLSSVVMASDPTTFGLDVYATSILAIVALGLAVVVRVVLVRCKPRGQQRQALLRRCIVLLLPLAVCIASAMLIELGTPFHVRFAWSRVALERAAGKAAPWSVSIGTKGQWIGLFRIYGVEADERGRTHFSLGGCGMLDHCELVYDPRPDSPENPDAGSLDRGWRIVFDPF